MSTPTVPGMIRGLTFWYLAIWALAMAAMLLGAH